MIDWKKVLEDAGAGLINEWSGNITLPNCTTFTNLRVDGREDARALLDTIQGMSEMGFVTNPAPVNSDTLSQRIELYLQYLRNAPLTEGNLPDASNTLAISRELTGSDMSIGKVNEHHVRGFLSDIHHWPVKEGTQEFSVRTLMPLRSS